MLVRVENGTDAGRRVVREVASWVCWCRVEAPCATASAGPPQSPAFTVRVQPGHVYSCADCGCRRPS